MNEEFEDDIPVEGIDTALILENKLKQRVNSIVSQILAQEVNSAVTKVFTKYKNEMLMEISIKVGQMLRGIEEEERVPLWKQAPFNIELSKEE